MAHLAGCTLPCPPPPPTTHTYAPAQPAPDSSCQGVTLRLTAPCTPPCMTPPHPPLHLMHVSTACMCQQHACLALPSMPLPACPGLYALPCPVCPGLFPFIPPLCLLPPPPWHEWRRLRASLDDYDAELRIEGLADRLALGLSSSAVQAAPLNIFLQVSREGSSVNTGQGRGAG